MSLPFCAGEGRDKCVKSVDFGFAKYIEDEKSLERIIRSYKNFDLATGSYTTGKLSFVVLEGEKAYFC